MGTYPIRRKARRRNDAQRELSLKGVEARRRKREESAEALVASVCGTVTFDGPMFGGSHVVRVAEVSDGRPVFDLIVDGMLCGIKTERGIRALIAGFITGRAQ